MNIVDAAQGSQQWLDIRAKHFTASEAPAMMGASKYQTRAALLRQKATGLAEEVDDNKQRLFDRGHAAEAAVRPIVEAIIGAELFPATGSLEVDGLPLLASFDGITMLEDRCWENKLMNNGLAESIRNCEVEPHYYWQLEQQLLVSGAEKVYFTCSDGTPENTVGVWYLSNPERRAQLIAGWKQFAEDLANYQYTEPAASVVAAPIESLPALAVTVTGSISLTHNLERFGKRLTEFVGWLNSKPETDQDFADLDAAVKVLKEAEAQLDAAEKNALAQTTTIADMQNLVAMYRKVARDNRLLFEKVVKQEKANRKAAIITEAMQALSDHVAKLNQRIGGNWMPAMNDGRFAAAIAGLKSLDSMRDKVAGALAQAKIEANEIADTIQANRSAVPDEMIDLLFPDFVQVCTKERLDFANLLASRVAAHKEAAERAAEDQRGKADVGSAMPACERTTAAPDAGFVPVEMPAGNAASAASTPPIPSDEAMIDDFLKCRAINPAEKKALRAHLLAWETYRVKLEMAAAA